MTTLWLHACCQALLYHWMCSSCFLKQGVALICVCVSVCACVRAYIVTLSLTNVSFLQGRRVIYTITCHSYNGSHSLASFHNDKFLLRWCTGEHNFSVVSVTVSDISNMFKGFLLIMLGWSPPAYSFIVVSATPSGTINVLKQESIQKKKISAESFPNATCHIKSTRSLNHSKFWYIH
jgi:hypothetical protein